MAENIDWLFCDGKCSECDSCTKEKDKRTCMANDFKLSLPARKTEGHNYCNGCPHAELAQYPNKPKFYNWYCLNTIDLPPIYKTRRIVRSNVESGCFVDKPIWCPLLKKVGSCKKTWSEIKPLMEFKNIKSGHIYHVPPVNGSKRKDIIVENVYVYSFSYRVVGNFYGPTEFYYDSDVEWRFMTEIGESPVSIL